MHPFSAPWKHWKKEHGKDALLTNGLRIYLVNVSKSAVFCRFFQIYQINPEWKTSFFMLWYRAISQ